MKVPDSAEQRRSDGLEAPECAKERRAELEGVQRWPENRRNALGNRRSEATNSQVERRAFEKRAPGLRQKKLRFPEKAPKCIINN